MSLLLTTVTMEAQQYLVIQGEVAKIVKIETAHEIGVLIHGEEDYYRGYLTAVGDSSIFIEGGEIQLREISAVRIYKPFFKTIGVAQRIAAGGIVGLNGVNSLLNGYRPVLTESEMIWAGVLFATSYVWDFFSRKTYETSDGYRFSTINYANLEQ
ncbi:MAG: hypothetical protein EP346_06735 [Bacteroidetes bacterium]|nr:MAG: hypothetical protein EP346_06735 [Bacteroidota bacterium]